LYADPDGTDILDLIPGYIFEMQQSDQLDGSFCGAFGSAERVIKEQQTHSGANKRSSSILGIALMLTTYLIRAHHRENEDEMTKPELALTPIYFVKYVQL
jgi:hypothetical protein